MVCQIGLNTVIYCHKNKNPESHCQLGGRLLRVQGSGINPREILPHDHKKTTN